MEQLSMTPALNKQLVIKKGDKYIPLFNAEEVNRDKFFLLRKQLINLGCDKDNVLSIAKRICMDILKMDNEHEYLQYILEDTYQQCKQNILSGYDVSPVQDIQTNQYSHVNLFSSIYGYEIEYLRSKGIYSSVADIGCGEGIFVKLARDFNIEAVGYEIEKPIFSHNVKINLIEDFHDIKQPYECIIYNHVLEHNITNPSTYLNMVIDHFESNLDKTKLKLIMVSLPMHLDIESHLASNHCWVCTERTYLDEGLKKSLEENNLKIFNPTLGFSEIKKNFQLTIKNKIGVYVLEKK
jgi:hypothetical protein